MFNPKSYVLRKKYVLRMHLLIQLTNISYLKPILSVEVYTIRIKN